MSTTTLAPATAGNATTAGVGQQRPAPTRIPFGRILSFELRKMFDTRAGLWLLASIGLTSAVATAVTILLGDRETVTLESFAAAVGSPTSVILPVIGVLAVTSEWSQRTALSTFTQVPGRLRVIGAKLVDVLAVGAVSMLVALGIGATGNLVTAAVTGTDPVWDIPLSTFAQIILANELGMLLGFVLGLLLRSSPAAIVGYFVVNLVLPGLSGALASSQRWWAENAGWLDINDTRFQLFDATLSAQDWAQLAVTSTLWIVVPFLIGLRLVLRAEVT